MPRKSSASPPATCTLFHVFPLSVVFRIAPFDPQTQATACLGPGACFVRAILTPRKFVSTPVDCWDHNMTAAPGPIVSHIVQMIQRISCLTLPRLPEETKKTKKTKKTKFYFFTLIEGVSGVSR